MIYILNNYSHEYKTRRIWTFWIKSCKLTSSMFPFGVVLLSCLHFLSNDTLSFAQRATLHLTSSSSLLWVFISLLYVAFLYSSVLIPWSLYTTMSSSSYCTSVHIITHSLLMLIFQIQYILDFLVLLTFLSNISIITCFQTISCKMSIFTTIKS